MPAVLPGRVEMGQFVVKADQKGREFGPKAVPLGYLIATNTEIQKRIGEFLKLREKISSELPAFFEKLKPQVGD